MKNHIHRITLAWFRFQNFIYFYFAMFWVMNGLDKFILPGNEKTVQRGTGMFMEVDGVLTPIFRILSKGFGKDRTSQFMQYFDKINLGEEWIQPVLTFAGIFELLVGAFFLYALAERAIKARRWYRLVSDAAWKGSLMIFIGLSALDIATGDRTELWEHGTYILVTIGAYLGVKYLDRSEAKGVIG